MSVLVLQNIVRYLVHIPFRVIFTMLLGDLQAGIMFPFSEMRKPGISSNHSFTTTLLSNGRIKT